MFTLFLNRVATSLSAASDLFDATQIAKSLPNGTPYAPGEPSTVVLALIGVGIIASYIVARRRSRGQQYEQQTRRSLETDAARTETPRAA